MKKKKGLIKVLSILILSIFLVILGWFAFVFFLITSMNSSNRTPVLTTSEARHNIQKMFDGVNIDISSASGYRESQWPGEYVSYYRFYAPSQDINNILNKFKFKETKYKSTLKFEKINTQPDWWNLSELTQAKIYSSGNRWLVYDRSMGIVFLYSSSGEFGVTE